MCLFGQMDVWGFSEGCSSIHKATKMFSITNNHGESEESPKESNDKFSSGKKCNWKIFPYYSFIFIVVWRGEDSLSIAKSEKCFFLLFLFFFLFIFLLSLHSSAPSWVLPFFPCTFRAQANEIYVRHCLSSVPFLSFLLILLIPN